MVTGGSAATEEWARGDRCHRGGCHRDLRPLHAVSMDNSGVRQREVPEVLDRDSYISVVDSYCTCDHVVLLHCRPFKQTGTRF